MTPVSFGEELYSGLAGRNVNQKYSSSFDDTRKKFATYQRDAETGLDYAQSRYYSPMHGRFSSPDEFKGGPDELFDFEEDASDNPTFYADLTNPQSLNKYQYTYNNPYKYNDPTGHCPFCIPVVAGALYLILSNPTPTGPRPKQTNLEAAADVFGVLPGGKVAGGLVGGVLLKGATKAAVKQTVKRPANRAVKRGAAKVAKSQRVKPPTKKQRKKVYDKNRQKNNGKLKCDDCGTEMVPAKKSQKGVKPPKNEATIDHIDPVSKGGTNAPTNLRGVCRDCNRVKSDNE